MYNAKKLLIAPGPNPLKNIKATIIGGNVLSIFMKIFMLSALYLPNKLTEDKYDVKIAVTAANIVALNAISILTINSVNIFGTYARSGFIIPFPSTLNCFNPIKNLS